MPPNDFTPVLLKFGVSLGLGLLVGLQRERSSAHIAGIRTFPLITVLGTLCGFLARDPGGWVAAAGFLAIAALVAIGNLADIRAGKIDPGLTTEAAMLVMFAVGAYLVNGHLPIAIAIGALVAVLLYLKPQMHAFAHAIADKDFQAIMQFVVISLVILPVLPNRAFGPYDVLNPFHMWVMVVFIVGISLAAYVIYKFWGHSAGTLAGGILGGLISSTATTVSYARRVRETPALLGLATLVITIASTVVFGRVLLIIGVRSPGFLPAAAAPLGIMLGVLVILSLACWLRSDRKSAPPPDPRNPCELKPAILFGLGYAAVLLAVAFARDRLGATGLYSVAALSGLTDMDAITLSVSELVVHGDIAAGTGWRAILTAALSNIVFKACIAAALGGTSLLLRLTAIFAIPAAVAATLLALWPG